MVGETSTFTPTLTQTELEQPIVSHLDQYLTLLVGAAIVFGLPVPTSVPPQLNLYQTTLSPEPPVAVKTILPPAFEQ